MIPESLVTWFLGVVLLARLGELVVVRRRAEALLAAGAEEHAVDLHVWTGLFHALWLASLAVGADEHAPPAVGWMLAATLLLVLRLARIRALGPAWTWRLFRDRSAPRDRDARDMLLRDPHYLPLAAELLVIPLAAGLWWLSLPGLLAYAALAARRLQAERAG